MQLSFEIETLESGKVTAYCLERRGLVVFADSINDIAAQIPLALEALDAAEHEVQSAARVGHLGSSN